MSVNEVMDDEKLNQQVIMVHGKMMSVRDVLEEIKRKAKDKKNRDFAEG